VRRCACPRRRIAAIGANLEAPQAPRRSMRAAASVMPGGIDPHTHLGIELWAPFRSDDSNGQQGALSGGTTMVVGFLHPQSGQSLLAAYRTGGRKRKARPATTAPHGDHLVDKQVFDEMETLRQNLRHQHVQLSWRTRGPDGPMTNRSTTRSTAALVSAQCRWCMPQNGDVRLASPEHISGLA